MRLLLPVLCLILLLPGCTKATASRIDANTYRIDGPPIPGGSSAPNLHLARQICPNGFRVLNSRTYHNSIKGLVEAPGDTTNWTIRCI